MDLKALYQEILNEHNLNPNNKGETSDANFVLRGVNPSCGDDITLNLKVSDDGIITGGTFSGSGCAISQASVDMMLDNVIGKSKDEALRLASLFMDMIKGNAEGDALEDLDEAASLQNISTMPARVKCAVLGWHTMEEMLNNDQKDFGKEIIPMAIKTKKVNSYIFNGYWEDIGTIRSFYEATLDLTNPVPNFNFYDEEKPVYTYTPNLPPSKINNADMATSLASEGCIIGDSRLQHSVIGVRSIINEGCDLNGVIMMGSDYYETESEKAANRKQGVPNIGIGKGCKINKTIIDKNAKIGNNCSINATGKRYEDGDHGSFYSAEGIIVIRKGAIIPDGTVI